LHWNIHVQEVVQLVLAGKNQSREKNNWLAQSAPKKAGGNL
jgi:hypothetical protein